MNTFHAKAFLRTQEVTPKHYEDMLCCLPPERQAVNAFLVGEATDYGKDQSGRFNARYQLYFEDSGKFYNGGLASVGDFDAFVLPPVAESGRCMCGCHEIIARPAGCASCSHKHRALAEGRTDDEKDGIELAEDRKCVRCTEALERNDDLLCGACSYMDAIY